jgi:hypothetical protein
VQPRRPANAYPLGVSINSGEYLRIEEQGDRNLAQVFGLRRGGVVHESCWRPRHSVQFRVPLDDGDDLL